MREASGLRIGQVAERSGFAASAIRFYESAGVLPEPERIAGQRRYDESVLARLAAIDVARRAGFSLAEIGQLLSADESERSGAALRELARRKLADVEELIARAEAMRNWLRGAELCDCPTFEDCALFD